VNSVGLQRQCEHEIIPDLGAFGQVSTNPRQHYQRNDYAGGPISWCVAYDDSSVLLLAHILGTVGSTSLGGGLHRHDITLASPVPTGLTLEQGNGTHSFNSAEVFEGCKFTSARLALDAQGILMCEAEVIAQTSGGLAAPGTPTFSSGGEHVKHNHAAVVTLGGVAVPLKSYAITIDRGLERLHEIGSLFTQEPVETRLSVTIDCVAAWQQNNIDTNYLAATEADFVDTFTGSGGKVMEITGHNAMVWSMSRPVSGPGMVEQRFQFKCFADATDQGLKIAVTNGNASAIAN
jgi:hypothetical protein